MSPRTPIQQLDPDTLAVVGTHASITHAASAMGMVPSALNQAVKKGIVSGGFVWRRIPEPAAECLERGRVKRSAPSELPAPKRPAVRAEQPSKASGQMAGRAEQRSRAAGHMAGRAEQSKAGRQRSHADPGREEKRSKDSSADLEEGDSQRSRPSSAHEVRKRFEEFADKNGLEPKILDWIQRKVAEGDWQAAGSIENAQGDKVKLAANLSAAIDCLCKSMVTQQAELASAELGYDKLRGRLGQNIDSIKRGKLDSEAVVGLKTSMDESASLSRQWYQNSADLQKLVVGYFRLMLLRTPVKRKTKDDFERVLLTQECITRSLEGVLTLEQPGLLEDGQLTLQSTERVDAILSSSSDMARQALERSVDLQALAGDALVKAAAAAEGSC
mmetsp:Transcript_33894/g.91753  ORF Transcript_33894/g.91753 Transcript_33894/m.91753 type:complete len:387 (-) Transcript_33894:34-1194(-)